MFLNGGGCVSLPQPLLEREEDACCDKDCNGFIGVSRGLTRVARRLNKNGSKDCYKWFSGLLQMARRSNKKGLEGEHGWKKPYCKWQRGLARLVEWLSDMRNIPVRIFGLA